MKFRIRNELIPLNLLVIILIIVILFLPLDVLRIALGIPFLLFIPGYVFVAVLFPGRGEIPVIERIMLSFGMSIAVVPLIALILNLTPLGITVESMLYSASSFIFVVSAIAWFRRRRLPEEERLGTELQLRLWGFSGSVWDKALSAVLVVTIVVSLGALGYIIAVPKVGEQFTEFYILGQEGEAANYPHELTMGESGKVVVGIINHEHQDMRYYVEIRSEGTLIGKQESIVLQNDEKWEEEVDIIPVRVGENQKFEFLLFKEEQSEPYSSLYLWIDVKEKG